MYVKNRFSGYRKKNHQNSRPLKRKMYLYQLKITLYNYDTKYEKLIHNWVEVFQQFSKININLSINDHSIVPSTIYIIKHLSPRLVT